MKWQKFRKLQERHSWILSVLGFDDLVGHPKVSESEVRARIRRFATGKLDYIAFRPFDGLDLQKVRNDGRNTFVHAAVTEKYLGGDPECWYKESWQIFWHLADRTENQQGDLVEWKSLGQKIEETKKWWLDHIRIDPVSLTLDRIVKVASSGRGDDTTKVSVEIYNFEPQNRWVFWPPPPAPKTLTPDEVHEAEQHRRYVTGEPMLPIMPSR
jgi:hypothetical protein